MKPVVAQVSEPLNKERSALEITVSYGESVMDVRHLTAGRSFIIGEGKAADLTVASDELPASEFPLVRTIDGRFVVTFLGDQRGEVEQGGVFRPLQWLKTEAQPDELPGCFRFVLPADSRATLRFGGLTLSLRYVTPPDRVDDDRSYHELRYSTLLLAFSSVLVVAIGVGLLSSFRPELGEMSIAQTLRAARFFGQTPPAEAVRQGNVVLDSAPLVTGLDAKTVSEQIAANADALSRCAALLPTGSAIRATIVVSERVSVSTEALNRNQGNEGLDCVRETLERIKYEGSGRVVYTIGVAR